MAHATLLIDEEPRRRMELINKCFRLWETTAEEYRVLPIKYAYLRQERKRLKIKGRTAVISADRGEFYPEIPFFRILGADEAMAYLQDKSTDALEAELKDIEDTLATNYAYRTARSVVAEITYLIAHRPNKARKQGATLSLATGKPLESIGKKHANTWVMQMAE